MIERSLEHRQHPIRAGAALANFLVGGWLGPILRLVTLGAALCRGGGHGGQPAAQLLGGEFADHEIAEHGENVHVDASRCPPLSLLGPACDQRSTKDWGACASLPPFAAVPN